MLKSGIPTISLYKDVLESSIFKEMEVFDDDFLRNNRKILRPYIRKWVKDPLHQWSRRFEYPFVFSHLERFGGGLQILDAGSGSTFFPYFVSLKLGLNVNCFDNDSTLVSIFENLNKNNLCSIKFTLGNLESLPYKENFFDAIYSISVLEHLESKLKVIKEFKRVLKPGGLLILTFDISLDGKSDISKKDASVLLDSLLSNFQDVYGGTKDITLINEVYSDQILTTKFIKKIDRSLLPFKHRFFTKDLTCMALVFKKKDL